MTFCRRDNPTSLAPICIVRRSAKGFFAVAGSNACIKISGRISAGVGFEPSSGAVRSFEPHIGGNPADTAFDAAAAASGDLRFDTAAGPARVYVGVRKDTNPGWLVNGQ